MKCPNCGYHANNTECYACGTRLVEVVHKETKIKPVAKKMGENLREYAKLRKKFLADNPICCVFKELKSTNIHHAKGRGKYLLDVSTWKACSMEGHRKIEDYPIWAKDNGFTISRLTSD